MLSTPSFASRPARPENSQIPFPALSMAYEAYYNRASPNSDHRAAPFFLATCLCVHIVYTKGRSILHECCQKSAFASFGNGGKREMGERRGVTWFFGVVGAPDRDSVHCLCLARPDLANPLQFLGGGVRLFFVSGALLL